MGVCQLFFVCIALVASDAQHRFMGLPHQLIFGEVSSNLLPILKLDFLFYY